MNCKNWKSLGIMTVVNLLVLKNYNKIVRKKVMLASCDKMCGSCGQLGTRYQGKYTRINFLSFFFLPFLVDTKPSIIFYLLR